MSLVKNNSQKFLDFSMCRVSNSHARSPRLIEWLVKTSFDFRIEGRHLDGTINDAYRGAIHSRHQILHSPQSSNQTINRDIKHDKWQWNSQHDQRQIFSTHIRHSYVFDKENSKEIRVNEVKANGDSTKEIGVQADKWNYLDCWIDRKKWQKNRITINQDNCEGQMLKKTAEKSRWIRNVNQTNWANQFPAATGSTWPYSRHAPAWPGCVPLPRSSHA